MPAPIVYLVRHGETEWSASGKHTSTTDLPLTEAGRAAAARLQPVFAGVHLGLVLSSPRARARETARLAGLQPELDDDLAEFAYGEYEGRTTPEIRAERPGWDLWTDGAPGGETAAAVGRRADRVIERALEAGGDVALFAHGHLLRILGARWIGQPAAAGATLALSTGAVCRLGFERERRVIWGWNDTSHLRGQTRAGTAR